jgi:pimeloyl-ACP methyl ester carboxylesterase
MDHWDPAVTDGLARDRDVILFNNAGVSSSSGEVPTTVQVMGADAVAFITALGLPKVDVLGFSIGGFIAQEIVLQAPISSGASFWSAPARAVAKVWLPSRRGAGNLRCRL